MDFGELQSERNIEDLARRYHRAGSVDGLVDSQVVAPTVKQRPRDCHHYEQPEHGHKHDHRDEKVTHPFPHENLTTALPPGLYTMEPFSHFTIVVPSMTCCSATGYPTAGDQAFSISPESE